jgi:simple sugar transport system permease protein
MHAVLEGTFVIGLLTASLRMATPLILGMTGELVNEKSGILNLGIEGTMLLGALTGFLVVRATDALWLGVVAAGISGSLTSIIFAFFIVTLGVSQLVSGLGIFFFAEGLSYFLYRLVVGNPTVPPTIEPFSEVSIPLFSRIPLLGPVIFEQYALVYFAFVTVALSFFILYKTHWGLKIRTVGENPATADTVGVSVAKVRYWSLIWGGFLIGIGGSFLSLAQSNMFTFGQVSGRGWICLALVIFGGWRPGRCLLGALLFGGIDALQFRLQTMGLEIPHQFFLMLPYLMTILALILMHSRRATSPAALLMPYRREE